MLNNFKLVVDNGGNLFFPPVTDGLRLETRRAGAPARLTFSIVGGGGGIREGNAVKLIVNRENVFFGFVFRLTNDKNNVVDVTCYDQMRYLKNKDTYVYQNMRASDVIRMVARDFELNLGTIATTTYTIPQRDESNISLLDIIYTALDFELVYGGNMFVLFDDFGRLTLRALDSMRIGVLIDAETAENYDFQTTINSNTYNRIKLVRENNETGMRDIYVVQDGRNIDRWGILQYFNTLQEGDVGQTKARALLNLFNHKGKTLRIRNALGNVKVRAGTLPVVSLRLRGRNTSNHMLVEKCVWRISNGEFLMDLTLRGGDIHG